MITLQWQRCIKNALWCQFNARLLEDRRFQTYLGEQRIGSTGVYIIWTGIDDLTVLKIGSGILKEELAAHLIDPEIQAYKSTRLYVTWASTLSVNSQTDMRENIEDGIVKFLGVVFKPKLVERLPEVEPVIVNLPIWNQPVPPL